MSPVLNGKKSRTPLDSFYHPQIQHDSNTTKQNNFVENVFPVNVIQVLTR